ncbi:MAG: S8 family serine peptidase, partial [Candidatus Krumholzibacteriota bacterium]|nr:S8 family serine peptidase [Candidatus Krumholzibacteriota bacterium]
MAFPRRHLVGLFVLLAATVGTPGSVSQVVEDPELRSSDNQVQRPRRFFDSPSTPVRPVITYPAAHDLNRNRIFDILEPQLAPGVAVHPVDIVVTLFVEPVPADVDAFESMGGTIRSVWRHATWGLWGTMPSDRVAELAASYGARLCVIRPVEKISGRADMNVATEIVQVRNRVWTTYGYTGDADGSIAILDNGLRGEHNDLADHDNDNVFNDPGDWNDACAGSWNDAYHTVGWINEYNTSANPVDPYASNCTSNGHGTAVAGCAAGDGSGNASYKGIAPSSHIVGVRIGRCGDYPLMDAIDGMNSMVADRVCAKIKVANMSVSYNPSDPTLLMNTATSVVQNGIVFTCSAGNGYDDGPGNTYYEVKYPGQNSKLITVGATTDKDSMAAYSSHGPSGIAKPDLVAPGGAYAQGNGWINTCDNYCPNAVCGTGNNHDKYQERNGTSFSAPIVAGAASLVIDAWEQANSTSWTWAESEALFIKGILLMTSVEIHEVGENPPGSQPANSPGTKDRGAHDRVEGYGRLNVDAAVEAVTMTLDGGVLSFESFGTASTDKKVWARKIGVTGPCVEVFLDVPSTGDYDLYLYEDTPNANGIPIIKASSTTDATDTDEFIQIDIGATSDAFYLVVKWVSGSGTFRVHFTDELGILADATGSQTYGDANNPGLSWGDYDGDGDHDLYVTKFAGANNLYRNNGDGTFTDVSSSPLNDTNNGQTSIWGDYDNDGDLDLFLANFGTATNNKLFRNDGSGTFTDVTSTAGVAGPQSTRGANWVDYNNDGYIDIYVVDYLDATFGGANRLYKNNGNGTFTDIAPGTPLANTTVGLCAVWGDYDDDGDQDVYIS